jgi:6-phosphofructo-2-kinase/fructose-2,6-biphosphatase 4
MRRIAVHATRYETMETSGGPFVKIYNIGERLVVNNIRGYLQSRIVFFLMNVHHKKRTIWFARVRFYLAFLRFLPAFRC